MRIIFGLLGVAASLLMLIYRIQVRSWIGKVGWAERFWGDGGTYNLISLVAVILFFLSLMYMTGTIGFLVGAFTGTFFSSVN